MDIKQQSHGAPGPGPQDPYGADGHPPPGGIGGDGDSVTRHEEHGTPSRWRGARYPFELMARMDEDMDRLFRRLWGGARVPWRGRGADMAQQTWAPQVEVFEQGGRLHVDVDLPGMKKEEVKLSIVDDQLVIQGERHTRHESAPEQTGYFHSERCYGSFYRAIPLPEGVDAATAEARFDDGVLKVQFAAPQPRHEKRREVLIR